MIFESTRKHLIGLIKEELTDGVQPQGTTVDHVIDTTGGTHDDVNTSLEGTDVVTDGGTSDTGMNLKLHVVTKGDDDLLNLLSQLTGGGKDERLTFTKLGIKLGESTNGKGGGFTLLKKEENMSDNNSG